MGGTCTKAPTPPVTKANIPVARGPIPQKCIVLGAGYSGKTTCIKHLTSSMAGMSAEEMQRYAPVLEDQYRNLLENLIKFDRGRTPSFEMKQGMPYTNAEVLSRLQLLWKEYGSSWPLPSDADRTEALFPPCYPFETAKYLMDRAVARLGDPPEPVSLQDVLNTRIRTTGIMEKHFQMTCSDGEVLTGRVFDVGGPRNERKKWIHCFENITLLIFIVDLGSYCQTLWEDDHSCSLLEQLEIFDQISSSRWFPDTLVCLVFNHLDRFLALASYKPFNRDIYVDPPALGPGKEWEGFEYIKQLFLKKWVPHTHQAVPFIVTTSLVHEHPVFIHQETNDPVIVLTHSLPPSFPAVLCSLVGEYASGSDTLISPGMADAARCLALHLEAKNEADGSSMGGLKCQRHTYAPQDRVR